MPTFRNNYRYTGMTIIILLSNILILGEYLVFLRILTPPPIFATYVTDIEEVYPSNYIYTKTPPFWTNYFQLFLSFFYRIDIITNYFLPSL